MRRCRPRSSHPRHLRSACVEPGRHGQVELAQHRYRLPRLRGKGIELSRLGGGIGTRGPGETQLETDRRRIQDRVAKLQAQLRDLDRAAGRDRSLAVNRTSRFSRPSVTRTPGSRRCSTNSPTPRCSSRTVSLRLSTRPCASWRFPAARRPSCQTQSASCAACHTSSWRRFAPRSTRVAESDLLLHVVDASDADPDRQIAAVRTVLGEIGAGDLPELLVINKIDIADPVTVDRLCRLHDGAVALSARTGAGVESLLEAVDVALRDRSVDLELIVPYDRGDVIASLHRLGEVLSQEHAEGESVLKVRLPRADAYRFDAFRPRAV